MSILESPTTAQAIVVNTVGYVTDSERGVAPLPVGFMGKYRRAVRSKAPLGRVIEAGGTPESGVLTFAIFGRSLAESPHSHAAVRTGLRKTLAECEQRRINSLVLHLEDRRFVEVVKEIAADYPAVTVMMRCLSNDTGS